MVDRYVHGFTVHFFLKGKDFVLAESGASPVESVNYDTFLDGKLKQKKKKEPTLRRDVKL